MGDLMQIGQPSGNSTNPDSGDGTPQSSGPAGDAKNLPFALDRLMLSPLVLGVLVLLMALLAAVSGWKIVNLETEKTVLKVQRERLETDLATYAKIHQQVPALRQQIEQMGGTLAELKGTVTAAQEQQKGIEEQVRQRTGDLGKLHEQIQLASANTKALADQKVLLEKELKALSADKQMLEQTIDRLKDEKRQAEAQLTPVQNRLVSLQNQVGGLEKQRSDLERGIERLLGPDAPLAGLVKQAEAMQASLQDLSDVTNRSGRELTEAVGQVTSRNVDIDKASRQITISAAGLQTTATQLGRSAVDLEAKQRDLEKSIGAAGDEVDNVTGVHKKLLGASQTLGAHHQELQGLVTAFQQSAADLKTQINDSLKSSIKDVVSDRQALADEVTGLGKLANELKSIIDKGLNPTTGALGTAEAKTKAMVDDIDKALNKIQEHGKRFNSFVDNAAGAAARLEAAITALEAARTQSQPPGESRQQEDPVSKTDKGASAKP